MQIETDLKYCFFDAGTVSNPWSGSVCKFRSLGFCEYRNNQGCGKCFPFFFQRCQPLKSGDSLFCTTALTPPPTPLNVNSPTKPPCPQIDPAAMAEDIIWSLAWSTGYQNLLSSLSVTKYMQKCPRNCTMNKKSLNFERRNGLNNLN